ncbi:hypothetical protein [Nocardia sp. NPDC056100]|uniref:hypothetical protein n=1 Tax=Nocardia sp. NPDC056100 TaxID=3345712 RepID=UPI0035E3B00F
MPTPLQVLTWDISGYATTATNATQIADAIVKASGTMHATIHDLLWQGAARQSAEAKADAEQTQMRAIATAYDDLATACAGAANAMADLIATIKSIILNYVHPPVSIGDDWSIEGVEDWNSEAGVQLSRLAGLASTLFAADAEWGAKIAAANGELEAMAPATALAAANAVIQADKKNDTRADPERIRTSAAAFQQMFGHPPTSPTDWATAEVLNPKSYDPKYQNIGPEIKVVRINPVQGQGVVRAAEYIERGDVFNFPSWDRGDGRTNDMNFDPEHARVTTYVDYENGVVVMRQNPSVTNPYLGDPEAKVAEPQADVWQAGDGSVRVQYRCKNPFAAPDALDPWDHSVNGDLVFSPGSDGVSVNGIRTNYPWLEVYQDAPNGASHTVALENAKTGDALGPATNLPDHHNVGFGANAFRPFMEYPWSGGDLPPARDYPGTAAGPVSNPPMVHQIPLPKGVA